MCHFFVFQSLLCPSLEPPRKKRKIAGDINNKKSSAYKELRAEVHAALKVLLHLTAFHYW